MRFNNLLLVLNWGSKKSDYTVYQVSDKFKGTLAKKVGSVGIQDDIEIYVSDNIKDYVMMDESNGTRTCSIYNSKGLESSICMMFF